ncbi:hypothetical protein D3C75_500080 [compost metagenome]
METGELQLLVNANRAKVYSYFQTQYGVQDKPGFWETVTAGGRPLDYLLELTGKRLAEVKLQQVWAREEGLTEDISYGAFLNRWAEENALREQKLKRGQIIYGPKQYGAPEYYEYVLSNWVIQLKTRLAETVYKPDEQQLLAYYESHKQLYAKPEAARLGILYISRQSPGAQTLADKALELIRKGQPLDQVAAVLGAAPEEIQYGEYRTDSKGDETEISRLATEAAAEMKPGQTNSLVPAKNGWIAVTCLEQFPASVESFESVRGSIAADYANSLYQSELSRRVSQAHIDVNKQELSKLVNP